MLLVDMVLLPEPEYFLMKTGADVVVMGEGRADNG